MHLLPAVHSNVSSTLPTFPSPSPNVAPVEIGDPLPCPGLPLDPRQQTSPHLHNITIIKFASFLFKKPHFLFNFIKFSLDCGQIFQVWYEITKTNGFSHQVKSNLSRGILKVAFQLGVRKEVKWFQSGRRKFMTTPLAGIGMFRQQGLVSKIPLGEIHTRTWT